ncbi:hypothetical protein CC2G_006578 [Coprinopsis cinerea AmutBmut pab1-1]|nr:hypothetical protein CC2G_006578 [Coprinopsis cinerea AmutBmut pab1-1]
MSLPILPQPTYTSQPATTRRNQCVTSTSHCLRHSSPHSPLPAPHQSMDGTPCAAAVQPSASSPRRPQSQANALSGLACQRRLEDFQFPSIVQLKNQRSETRILSRRP